MASWDSLSKSQQGAVRHEDGPSAVYAGPGSGKTRVVTLRAARMASVGKRLLVTTFTNDATEEMRTRIKDLLDKSFAANVQVSTMHALCLQILRAQGVKFQLLTDAFLQRNLAESAQAMELDGGVGKFLTRQSYLKNCGYTHATYTHDGSSEDAEFLRCWRAYEKGKREKSLREFDDLILETGALLESDEALRRHWAGKFTHIIVDECQDMNSPQYAVAFALGRDHKNVMLVGDLDQSLYSFRGASAETFRQFAANPKTAVYELRENYRCTRAILAFADSLIRQDENRRALQFIPTRPEGEPIVWQRFPDAEYEALAVGERILQLAKSGVKYRDMAVLYRVNAQSEAFERNFAVLEIPYTMREDGDFYARKEVQGILAYLNFFQDGGREVAQNGANTDAETLRHPTPDTRHPFPDEWLLALLNVPNRKLSRMVGGQMKTHAEIRGKRIWDILPDYHADDLRAHRAVRQMTQELQRIAEKLPHIVHAGEAIKTIRSVTRFDDWLHSDEKDEKDNDRIQNVARMQAAAAHYPTIGAYLKAVQKVRDEAARRKAERAKKRREQDEVVLSTGHGAKGLEWRAVFAVGWSEEILPHHKAEDMDEERRIAYVIATRARDLLYVSSLDSWNDATTAPTRFLTGLNLTAYEPPENESEAETAPDLRETDAPPDAFGGLFIDF